MSTTGGYLKRRKLSLRTNSPRVRTPVSSTTRSAKLTAHPRRGHSRRGFNDCCSSFGIHTELSTCGAALGDIQWLPQRSRLPSGGPPSCVSGWSCFELASTKDATSREPSCANPLARLAILHTNESAIDRIEGKRTTNGLLEGGDACHVRFLLVRLTNLYYHVACCSHHLAATPLSGPGTANGNWG